MVSGVFGGVGTHADVHVAAELDQNGGLLEIESFSVDAAGYRSLLSWLLGFGPVVKVGVEGTGSYGVGLARHLHDAGVAVVEVDRPNRQKRRKRGKSDPIDAEAAERAALSGEASVAPKWRDGTVEQIRVLMVARRSARMCRNQALNELRQIVICAPEEIRVRFKDRYKSRLRDVTARTSNAQRRSPSRRRNDAGHRRSKRPPSPCSADRITSTAPRRPRRRPGARLSLPLPVTPDRRAT